MVRAPRRGPTRGQVAGRLRRGALCAALSYPKAGDRPARRKELPVDDRGSGWSSRPGDQDRLARVEQELEALEDEVTQLRRILPGRLASGQRPAQGGWSNPDPTVDTPATSLRAKALQPRYRPDPIGRVEARVSALRWEVERLLRIVDLPGRAMAPGPRIAPRSKEASSAPSPRDTPPRRTQRQCHPAKKPTPRPVTISSAVVSSQARDRAEQDRITNRLDDAAGDADAAKPLRPLEGSPATPARANVQVHAPGHTPRRHASRTCNLRY